MVERIDKERKSNKIERSEELLNESKLPTRMKIAEIRVQRKSEQFRQKYDLTQIFKEKAYKFSKEVPMST